MRMEPLKTTHQYLDLYPVRADSEKLIVGTIHPHFHEQFELPFFYGNRLSIWRILDEAFPGEMGQPLSVEGIHAFLVKRKISVSDTILECLRKNRSALDKDLIPTRLNHELIGQIRHSNINQVFFTSGFGTNNAFRLFYEKIMGLKISPEIRKNREVWLDKSYFGRPVQLTILYSPSGAANIAMATSALYLPHKKKYEAGGPRPVHRFKVDYYREKFGGKQ
jgi:G:T/U-mismatch repair DNA glycosylase